MKTYNPDKFDKKILNLIQRNNQMSHESIGQKIGLSTSAVRRRLCEMRMCGMIEREVAILKPGRFGVTLIASITLSEESVEAYHSFDQCVFEMPEVMQSYHIAGDADYILIVHIENLEAYENWMKENIMNNPYVARCSTTVSWSCKKFETAISM